MYFPQTRRQVLIVLAQLGEHVQWLNELGVVVLDPLKARNVSNRSQRRTAELADALGNRVGHRIQLISVLIEQQVIVAEMRPTHVPMEVLGLQIQREYIGEDCVHAGRDVPRGRGPQIRRRY